MQSQKWGPVRTADGWTVSTWAPGAASVDLLIDDTAIACTRADDGFWTAKTNATAGTTYGLRIDGADVPDPASRLQYGDVHGPSVLYDHDTHDWLNDWSGRDWSEAVIYELHVGTFTPEGNFAAAAEKFESLAALGITAIEIMPIGQFSGTRGWGYDGVLPFAPHPSYGTPADLKALVTRAHSHGLMVLLDVVMNHFGPDGAYLHQSAPEFFNPDRHTPWGAAIDFSQSAVRAYWLECARMWLTEYHFDGLRLDAVHQIDGPGAETFFAELAAMVRSLGRPVHIVLEDERNEPELREIDGLTANWNDDFHHAIHTALTGESQDYYKSFAVDPIGDLVLALEHGHIEEGQEREGRDAPRGKPSHHLPPTAFVNSTQTHDQIGNRPHGDRLLALADPKAAEAAFALLLVSPFIPMIFMGEERGETAPFQFFADYHGELGRMVREGRAAEFAGIAELGDAVPDPTAVETFFASRIDWSETERVGHWTDLTKRCLAFRSQYVVPLLKSGLVSAKARRCGDRALQACWAFGDGSLCIALNLGSVGTPDVDLDGAQFKLNRLDTDSHALTAKAVLQ